MNFFDYEGGEVDEAEFLSLASCFEAGASKIGNAFGSSSLHGIYLTGEDGSFGVAEKDGGICAVRTNSPLPMEELVRKVDLLPGKPRKKKRK